MQPKTRRQQSKQLVQSKRDSGWNREVVQATESIVFGMVESFFPAIESPETSRVEF